MKNITQLITLLLCSLVVSLANPGQSFAQDSTNSANPTETTRQLKERIQRIVDEKKDQIKGVIDDLSQQRTGFIGEVQRVTEESITINNQHGTRILPIDDQVTLRRNNNDIEISEIAVGDWLVVMGVEADDAFVPLRILASSTSLRPRSHVVALGSIADISRNSLTLLSRTGEEVEFVTNTNTSFQDNDGEEVLVSEFVEEMQVIVVGYEDKDDKILTVVRTLAPLTVTENE